MAGFLLVFLARETATRKLQPRLCLHARQERHLFFIEMFGTSNDTMADKIDNAPMNIATISAGFEKGDFLVREEQGNRVYFDFFEEVRSTNASVEFCSTGE